MKNRFLLLIIVALLMSVSITPTANAAPTGKISLGPNISADNFVIEGQTEQDVKIDFKNDASSQTAGSAAEIASTVQYLRISAAIINPARIAILGPADWQIIGTDGSTVRTSGTVATTVAHSENFVPPGPVVPPLSVDIYTCDIGSSQSHPYTGASGEGFETTLPVLLPQETLRLIIDVQCTGVGDSIDWFFFRATEDNFQGQTYPTSISSITDKSNLYYSKLPGPVQTQYWLPLHNSYDPWDSDISSGHSFEQNSWNRVTTNTQYAKTNKVHHQSPAPDGGGGGGPSTGTNVIHICGIKFNDLDRDGEYDPETDGVINGVQITLLGSINPDQNAEDTYQGNMTIKETHGNPVSTGEGGDAAPGVYCFNLIEVKNGTYQFYIRIEEPQGTQATTPTLITLAPITVSGSEVVYRVDNNFGNYVPSSQRFDPQHYVGGELMPVNKLAVFAPYLALIGLAGITAFAMRKPERQRSHAQRKRKT